MKIGIIINTSKSNSLSIANKAIGLLSDAGAEILVLNPLRELDMPFVSVPEEEFFTLSEVVIAIGGDGTIIHSAKKAALKGKAVLGINAGRVGYLAGLEEKDISDVLKLISGEYTTEKRMMLSIKLGDEEHFALNDGVISKGGLSRMIDINAEISGEALNYRADGLIAATPTGSTAYSLSAGGPVIDPELESITLTPISPRSLFARSIILGSKKTVIITATAPDDAEVYLTIDGEESFKIDSLDRVEIKKAQNLWVKLIKLNDSVFLGAMAEKFNLLG